ncbi:MAG: Flp family type IVb pilin [Alphaproteobacteria bacterium]|nr:Flp family type IVb pilin [Alphaproteobacteria bacterium]
MPNKLRAFSADLLRDESGTVVIEYTLLASLIAMGILTATQLLTTSIDTMFINLSNKFS